MTLCLTAEEIEDVTRKKRYSAQIRVLRALGIEARHRPDGSILVDRGHYEAWARGARGEERQEPGPKTEPYWN